MASTWFVEAGTTKKITDPNSVSSGGVATKAIDRLDQDTPASQLTRTTLVTAGRPLALADITALLAGQSLGDPEAPYEPMKRQSTLISGTSMKYRKDFNDPAIPWAQLTRGPGATATPQANGSLVLATGTQVGETVLITEQTFKPPFRSVIGLTLSQKIAGQEYFVEVVGVNADGTLDELCVAAWKIAFADSSSVTSARLEANNGSAARKVSAQVGTAGQTAAGLWELVVESDEVWATSKASDSNAAKANPVTFNTVAPDPAREYRMRLRVRNTSVPASSTTVTVTHFGCVDYQELQTEVTGGAGNSGLGQSVPVQVVGGAVTLSGTGLQALSASVAVAGTSIAKVLSAATTNPTLVKSTAARLYGITLMNTGAATRWLKVFNKATAPVPGTDVPVLTVPLPPGVLVDIDHTVPIALATGYGYAITGAPADLDTTAVAAGEVVGHLLFA